MHPGASTAKDHPLLTSRLIRVRPAMHRHLIALLLAWALAGSVWAGDSRELFQRVVVLGASLSAGFDCTQPFGGPSTAEHQFAHYLEAALRGPHEPLATQASSLLFLQAPAFMEKQVSAAVQARPTLVVGLDALFWFCYGAVQAGEDTLTRFESGLRQLERLEAPLVVGDIPDASVSVGGMLSPEAVPSPAMIARCNARLKAWAAARKNVAVFPLAQLMGRAIANDAVELAGAKWPRGKSRTLLQRDLLHPSRRGLAGLAIGALELAARSGGASQEAIEQDVDVVYTSALDRARAAAAPAP